MEEKKIVYQIIIDIWNLAKEFDFKKLTDAEWEEFTSKAQELRDKYKNHGESIDLLFRDMFSALQDYYQRKN